MQQDKIFVQYMLHLEHQQCPQVNYLQWTSIFRQLTPWSTTGVKTRQRVTTLTMQALPILKFTIRNQGYKEKFDYDCWQTRKKPAKNSFRFTAQLLFFLCKYFSFKSYLLAYAAVCNIYVSAHVQNGLCKRHFERHFLVPLHCSLQLGLKVLSFLLLLCLRVQSCFRPILFSF